MTNTKRLRMHIKGDVKGPIYNVFHAYLAKKHNVKTHSIVFHNSSHIEVHVEGNKDSLWALVNRNRKGPMFCTVDELQIQFL